MRTFARVILLAALGCIDANGLLAQPITSLSEVTGDWTGSGSRGGKTDINIQQDGRFTTLSPLGQASGMAKLEDGVLVLPFSNNQGQIKFTRTNDTLEGPYVAGILTGTLKVKRVAK